MSFPHVPTCIIKRKPRNISAESSSREYSARTSRQLTYTDIGYAQGNIRLRLLKYCQIRMNSKSDNNRKNYNGLCQRTHKKINLLQTQSFLNKRKLLYLFDLIVNYRIFLLQVSKINLINKSYQLRARLTAASINKQDLTIYCSSIIQE